MRRISTKIHGMLDYGSVALLLALPRLLNWDDRTTTLLTIVGISALLYSLLTRYELGSLRVLPVKVHLALDFMSGLLLAAAPFLIVPDAGNNEKIGLMLLGVFEIGSALITQTQSPQEHNGISGTHASSAS